MLMGDFTFQNKQQTQESHPVFLDSCLKSLFAQVQLNLAHRGADLRQVEDGLGVSPDKNSDFSKMAKPFALKLKTQVRHIVYFNKNQKHHILDRSRFLFSASSAAPPEGLRRGLRRSCRCTAPETKFGISQK